MRHFLNICTLHQYHTPTLIWGEVVLARLTFFLFVLLLSLFVFIRRVHPRQVLQSGLNFPLNLFGLPFSLSVSLSYAYYFPEGSCQCLGYFLGSFACFLSLVITFLWTPS